MSAPSVPKDNSAQVAEQQQQQRDAQIKKGQHEINQEFKQFNPQFYDNYTQSYENNYDPQVDDQYNLALQNEKYNLARSGMIDSTPGMTANDLLQKSYQDQLRTVASNALSATNTLRGNVANEKSQLYALNSTAADPKLAASQAVAEAGALQTVPTYSPIGDLFGSLVNSTNQYLNGRYMSVNPYGYSAGYGFSPGGSLPAGGSGSVVGG